jgi:gas vesicle protein
MSTSKTVLTLLAGAVIGGALGFASGMLLAPDKGEVTRKKVKNAIDDITEEFSEKVDEMVNQFGDMVEEAQVVAEEKIPAMKKKKA